MNYFAHALPFLDDPHFVAGTGVPDWLGVADRRGRVRPKNVEPLVDDPDPVVAAVARGLRQHIRDDAVFHRTRAFAETTLELSAAFRRVAAKGTVPFSPTRDLRSRRRRLGQSPRTLGFGLVLAHLLVEVMLDWALAEENSDGLVAYYRALEAVDVAAVQATVNRMATRPTDRLAPMIFLFCRERILWDYGHDEKLWIRMNQVMRRVGFAPLPPEVQELFSAARQLVRRRRHELLEGIPVKG